MIILGDMKRARRKRGTGGLGYVAKKGKKTKCGVRVGIPGHRLNLEAAGLNGCSCGVKRTLRSAKKNFSDCQRGRGGESPQVVRRVPKAKTLSPLTSQSKLYPRKAGLPGTKRA